MDKQRAQQMFELANRLINLDASTLSEQQLQQRNDMIFKLKEEIKMLDEASLAQMRDYFKTIDPKVRSVSPTAKYVANTDPKARANMQKRFRSQEEYEEWLRQNGLKSISSVSEDDIDEGWKDKVAAGALAATMALGAAGAHARVTPGEQDPGINRLTGKPIATQVAPADQKPAVQAPSGYSKEYLQKAADPNRTGRYMISVEKAQQLLKQMGESVTEEFNGEYDDEAGMAESNLHTMARAVNGLLDTIKDNDNLPEWAQEKLAKAEMMVTSVWDYLLSQKEQGMDPKVEESKKPSPKLTPVTMKKTDPVSEEINTEAYERLQKVFAFKNYES